MVDGEIADEFNRTGLTETSTVVTMTAPDDIWFGSSGSILPGIECRIVDPEGNEITEYGKEGELIVKSPAVTLGYLNNEKATRETFSDGWMRTGDVAVVKKSKKGHEHVFIVDRIKELIKVKVRAPVPSSQCPKNSPESNCTDAPTSSPGPPSRPRRARGAPPHAPGRRRLRRHPGTRRPRRRGPQGVRRQGGRRGDRGE